MPHVHVGHPFESLWKPLGQEMLTEHATGGQEPLQTHLMQPLRSTDQTVPRGHSQGTCVGQIFKDAEIIEMIIYIY